MTQRLIAACVAVPAVIGLLIYAGVGRLPYATYQPGGTVDVLGLTGNGQEVIQVQGHEAYRDDGQLRMTTVRISPAQLPDEVGLGLTELMGVWLNGDNAVYPYQYVHAPEETAESNAQRGALQMASSQDYAVEVAMSEAGIDVPQVVRVAEVAEGTPADGVLQPDDVLVAIDGTDVVNDASLRDLITSAAAGEPLAVEIERAGRTEQVQLTPQEVDGRLQMGITPGIDYDFPFEVTIDISENIGGPSAGLLFSLAVYDTITPGSLTGGTVVAGTGEIAPDGSVGPIGGIQQKIAGARDDGADLFLVPIENCDDALRANPGDMELMMATTMHDVRVALEERAGDPDSELPSCEDADTILSGDSA